MRFARITILCLGTFFPYIGLAQTGQNNQTTDINVVYGQRHIFTIETPIGWINDKVNAQKIGLVNFFYAMTNTSLIQKSYMYVLGIDKESNKKTLQDFISGDLQTYRKKYPDFKYEIVEVEFNGGVKNGKLYSFSNLKDRYKEEVLYAETETAIIVFTFSATTSKDYENYQSVFDTFILSFNYRGDNPKPFLDYMKTRQ
ncbi:MAG: hypothetical protein FWH23_03005 [Bacteroidales bacterium]|nr:hypothetical protein [Bacteroidales bacterium]